jgi:antitoxin (DNA-binding transcriptional repressor) of toxin-antitoxin stability system
LLKRWIAAAVLNFNCEESFFLLKQYLRAAPLAFRCASYDEMLFDQSDGQETRVSTVNLAKSHLSELITQAETGDTPCGLHRQGKPVAQLTAISSARKAIEIAMLVSVTDGMQPQGDSAGDFMRKMRDGERY